MKKIKIFMMAAVLLLLCGVSSRHVFAAETISSASNYTLGTTQYGVITENGEEKQYYRMNLDSSGRIDISGTAYMEWIYLYLYDENGNELYCANPNWNSTSEIIAIDSELYLTKGTYYFCIGKDGGRIGEFNFRIDFTSSNESFMELNGGSNNSMATASVASIDGMQYSGQLALNDEKDFFKMNLAESGKIHFKLTFFKMRWVKWYLYDEGGNELASDNPEWNSTTEVISFERDFHLATGVYYIAICKDTTEYHHDPKYGRYVFDIDFVSAKESFSEINGETNNNDIYSASSVDLDIPYKGQIALNDDKDFYVLSLSSAKSLSINLIAEMRHIGVALYDVDGNEIWAENPSWNNTTQTITFLKTTTLSSGIYYIAICKDTIIYHDNPRTGNYTLSIEKLTQSNCAHSYSNYYVDATYFSQGYRLYTCEICGYSYKDDYSAKRVLDQGYLYSDCDTGKGKLYLSWSTVSDATGYQIRYSKDKSFKTGVVTKNVSGQSNNSQTISKLSRKKKYYVQVRPYIKSGGKTAYGKWSTKRALKTK